MTCNADVDFVFRCIELCPSLQHAERGLHRLGTRRALGALIEPAGQPALEALAADRPIFLMAVHVEAAVTNIIPIVKQLGCRRELDQDVSLLLFWLRIGLFFLFLWQRWWRRFPDWGALALFD